MEFCLALQVYGCLNEHNSLGTEYFISSCMVCIQPLLPELYNCYISHDAHQLHRQSFHLTHHRPSPCPPLTYQDSFASNSTSSQHHQQTPREGEKQTSQAPPPSLFFFPHAMHLQSVSARGFLRSSPGAMLRPILGKAPISPSSTTMRYPLHLTCQRRAWLSTTSSKRAKNQIYAP